MKFYHVTYNMPYEDIIGTMTIPAKNEKDAASKVKELFKGDFIININAVIAL